MIIAAVLFAVAAVLGLTLVVRVLRGESRSLGPVLAHGAFAAAGLVALAIAAAGDLPAIAGWGLGLFVVAALGGFVLVGLDRTGRTVPPVLAVGHGLIAVVAFLLLLGGIAGVG